MKYLNKPVLAALALAGLAFGGTVANAATITSNPGDLILAFRIQDDATGTGATSNLEIDLGTPAALITAAQNAGGTVSLSNYLSLSDLSSTYGASWFDVNTTNLGNGPSTSPLLWSVFGADTSNNLWTIRATAPARASSTTQHNVETLMANLYNDLNTATSTTNSNFAEVVNANSDSTSYYQSVTKAGSTSTPWGYNTFGLSVEDQVADPGDSINLYSVPTGTGAGTALGSFTLNKTTGLSFTVVPEPSTNAMIGLAAIVVVMAMRRRRVRA